MKTILLTLGLVFGGVLTPLVHAQTTALTIDPAQSSIDITIADAIGSSQLSGNATFDFTADAQAGIAQITELDLAVDESVLLNLFGGFASGSTTPGGVTVSMVTAGAPGAVTEFGNSFNQLGNSLVLEGDLEVIDGFGFAGGSQTFDLSGIQFLPTDFNSVSITQFGDLITISSSATMTGTLNFGAGDVPAVIQLNYVANGIVTAPVLLGDVNMDSTVDCFDIAPFISVLSARGFQAEADCNQSGAVNFLDIFSFIDQLMMNL